MASLRTPSTLSRVRACAAALALAAVLAGASDAAAHDAPAPRGMGEADLRRAETRALGATHAAQHAAQRRALRAWRRLSPAQRRRLERRARPRARVAAATEVGAWAGGQPLRRRTLPSGVEGVHAVLLPTGKVMWFSDGPDEEGAAVLWDPRTGGFEDVDPPPLAGAAKPANIWCAGQSLMADGRVLITGGNLSYPSERRRDWTGLNTVFTFDPFAKAWVRHQDMRHGRWYPSQMLMPDGRTVIVQGADEDADGDHDMRKNDEVEVFDPLRPLGQEVAFAGTVPQDKLGAWYPHTFWMPSGKGLVAGPEPANSWYVVPPVGEGALRIEDVADQPEDRTFGTAVLLPLDGDSTRGSVLQIGGAEWGTAARRSSTRFDEADGTWKEGPALNVGRAHHNTVLLPDESMVTLGGGVGDAGPPAGQWATDPEHKTVELYDPRTRRWKEGPAQAESRAYHSTALLLPDGSVVSAGDDYNGGKDVDTYEIYRPPYFFTGPRPQITSAPGRAGYGQTLAVGSPDGDVTRAVLVAPGATTHAVDMNQRLVRLGVTRTAGGYAVRTPTSLDVAPPGYYMLFLLDGAGRPSEAAWVKLDPAAPAPAVAVPPGSTIGPTGPGAGAAGGAGGSGAGPGREGAAGGDGRAPRVALSVGRVRDGRVSVRVTLDEAGKVALTLEVRRGARRTRATETLRFSRSSSRVVRLRLRPALRRALRARGARLQVRASARDRAGNRGTARAVARGTRSS